MKESARMVVLFEEMNIKFDAILEYVKDIPDIKQRLIRLEGDVRELKADMAIIKPLIREHSRDIAWLKARV